MTTTVGRHIYIHRSFRGCLSAFVALAKTSKSKIKTNTRILWPQAKTNAAALKTKANTSKGKAKAKTKHHWP